MKVMKYLSVLVIVISIVFFNTTSYSQFKKLNANIWKGVASYYHPKFEGRKTSNGEVFSNSKMTCANNFLKLGTYIKVTNTKNGKSIIVKVNDRMNPRNRRLIDLSKLAATKLGFANRGLGEVQIEVLDSNNSSLAMN